MPQLILKNIYISLTNRSAFQTQLWTYFSLYGLDLIFFCFLVKWQYHICVQKQRANSQQIGEIEIKSNLNSCYPTRQNNLKHTNTHRGGEGAQRSVCYSFFQFKWIYLVLSSFTFNKYYRKDHQYHNCLIRHWASAPWADSVGDSSHIIFFWYNNPLYG